MDIKFKKIKSIKEIQVDKSYDFEVENVHRIIAKHEKSNNAFYTSNCHHPDIEDFITAKQVPGKLTKFNMSVLIPDDFMDAVKNNKPWNLIFPKIHDDELTDDERIFIKEKYNKSIKKLYEELWDGNFKKWTNELGLPVNIYKTYKNANELWDIIMKSTYNRNEPGILFHDTINRMNNLYYIEYINSTNPCGEQLLPVGGSCLLGSLNVTQFINDDYTDWDYNKLKEYIPTVVRMMDDVNDLTYVPLKEQKKQLMDKRRIGLGIMGLGSALFMMKIRYGSDKSLKLVDKLMSTITNTAYKSSALIAKEKGTFPLYDKEKYLKSNFLKILDKETLDIIKKYGMRNSHCVSIQPTGNSSIVANTVSGGLEPVFMPEYIRTSTVNNIPDGINMPKNINWDKKENYNNWEWIKEGDEDMLKRNFENIIYKIDKSRGLTKETFIEDYGVKKLKEKNEWNADAEWAATTTNLKVEEHNNIMSVIAKYVDSAISKTINLPSDYSFENFKKVYYNAYDTGTIKGTTTYKAGTMTSVLKAVDNNISNNDLFDSNGRPKILRFNNAPKRPKELKCNVHNITAIGTKWTVFVGLMEDENGLESPFEIFAFKQKNLSMSSKITSGKMIKVKSGHYKFVADDDLIVLDNVVDFFDRDEQEAVTRSISGELRHGMKVNYIVQQLNKSEGTIVSFSKAIARVLNKHYVNKEIIIMKSKCPECGSEVVNEEGCLKCYSCGWSKCL